MKGGMGSGKPSWRPGVVWKIENEMEREVLWGKQSCKGGENEERGQGRELGGCVKGPLYCVAFLRVVTESGSGPRPLDEGLGPALLVFPATKPHLQLVIILAEIHQVGDVSPRCLQHLC